jgi:hypothetical protein
MDFLTLCLFQLRVQAFDDKYPTKYGELVITVDMIRNEYPPVFIGSPYSGRISESTVPGSIIVNITAQDGDNVRHNLAVVYLGWNWHLDGGTVCFILAIQTLLFFL